MELFDYFLKLYKEKKQLALLNCSYGVVAALFVIISGICALFNQSLGVSLLIVPLIAIASICFNIIIWALVKLALDAIMARKDEKLSLRSKKSK